jgi:low affinity Fe/Cu permease
LGNRPRVNITGARYKVQMSFIGLEHLTEEELEEIRRRCEQAAKAELVARRRPAEDKKSAKC